MKKFFLLLFIFHFSFLALSAQSWLWGQQGSSGSDTWGVTADSKGNTLITGPFSHSIGFGSSLLSSLGGDSYLVKYDSAGTLIWAKQSVGASACSGSYAYFAATDHSDNIYITGQFYDTTTFGPVTLISNTRLNYPNIFLAKYDNNGNVRWAVKAAILSNRGNNNISYCAATDASGNAYITGIFEDSIAFGAQTLKSMASFSEAFLVKYDSNGNVLWARQSSSASVQSYSQGTSVTADVSGNVYITGSFFDTVSFGTYTLTNASNHTEVFLAKYDVAGNLLWARQSSGPGVGIGSSVVADSYGNIYATGTFRGTAIFGTNSLNSSNGGDAFIVKYDANGNIMWAKQSHHNNTNGACGYSLATDKYNEIFFSGGGEGFTSFIFCGDTLNTSVSGDASVVMKIDTGGNALCGSIIYTGGDDNNTVACDPSGNYVYLGGDIADTIRFGNNWLNSFSNEIPFVARWLPCSGYDTNRPSEPPPLICGTIFIPTAFSPNNDGQNDVLYVKGPCINNMDFIIYDRWGNKVFESENVSTGWDGTYKGQPMNTGTYVWYLKAILYDGTTVNKKGNVSLVR